MAGATKQGSRMDAEETTEGTLDQGWANWEGPRCWAWPSEQSGVSEWKLGGLGDWQAGGVTR